MTSHTSFKQSGPGVLPERHGSGSPSSGTPGPALLPFQVCESCRGREGKLIDTRYGRGGFLVCEPCYGPMTLADWVLT